MNDIPDVRHPTDEEVDVKLLHWIGLGINFKISMIIERNL